MQIRFGVFCAFGERLLGFAIIIFIRVQWLLSEQLGVRTETYKVDLVGFMVKPYQKKVALDVALHVPGIIACEHMRRELCRNWGFRLKHL